MCVRVCAVKGRKNCQHRERGRERGKEFVGVGGTKRAARMVSIGRDRERETERKRWRVRESVCVCMCVEEGHENGQ